MPAEGAAPLGGGYGQVNKATPLYSGVTPSDGPPPMRVRNPAPAYGQRESRAGAPDPRVCQLPFGAWYFSPGSVFRIA